MSSLPNNEEPVKAQGDRTSKLSCMGWMMLLTLLITFAAAALWAYVLRTADERAATGPVVELGHSYRLRLAAVLHASQPKYEFTSLTQLERLKERVYNLLPAAMASRMGYHGPATPAVFIQNYGSNGITLVFQVQSDEPEWRNRRKASAMDLHRLSVKVDDLLNNRTGTAGEGRYQLQVTNPEGSFISSPYFLRSVHGGYSSRSTGSGNVSTYDPHIAVTLNPIPAVLPELLVRIEKKKPANNRAGTPVASFTIPNPYFAKASGLVAEGALPLSKVSGNVRVELEHLVTDAASDTRSAYSLERRPGSELLEQGLFLKPLPDDPDGTSTLAVFRVYEDDQLTTAWDVANIRVLDDAGDNVLKGSFGNWRQGDRLVAMANIGISWMKGAGDVEVELYRKANFIEGEMVVVETGLPAKGNYRRTNQEIAFWNTTATLHMVNHATTETMPEGWSSMTGGDLTFAFSQEIPSSGEPVRLDLVRVWLQNDVEKIPFTISGWGKQKSGSSYRYTFSISQLYKHLSRQEKVPDHPTTAVLEMVSPRMHSFAWRVAPTSATEEQLRPSVEK